MARYDAPMCWLAFALPVCGCNALLGLDPTHEVDAAPVCTGPAPGAFGPPTMIDSQPVVMGNDPITGPTLTADQSVLYYDRLDKTTIKTLTGTAWSTPAIVTSLDIGGIEGTPSLSYDGTHIFFGSSMPNGARVPYESFTTDPTKNSWAPPTPVAMPPDVAGPNLLFGVPSADGQHVVAWHGMATAYDLVEVERSGGGWSVRDTMANIHVVGAAVSDSGAQLSPDGCWMVFSRLDRSTNAHLILIAIRGADGTFDPPQVLATGLPPNSRDPWLSPDGNTLYFDDGNISGTLYSAPRTQ
jgi:WD40-like Beta Propeller Repeat